MWHLLFSCGGSTVCRVSTKAQAILEEIKALPPQEQREMLRELQQATTASDQGRAAQSASIRRGRGMFAGSGLLEALLTDRAKERARE